MCVCGYAWHLHLPPGIHDDEARNARDAKLLRQLVPSGSCRKVNCQPIAMLVMEIFLGSQSAKIYERLNTQVSKSATLSIAFPKSNDAEIETGKAGTWASDLEIPRQAERELALTRGIRGVLEVSFRLVSRHEDDLDFLTFLLQGLVKP